MGVRRGICSSTNTATHHARPVDSARVGIAREPGYDCWARWGYKKRWVRQCTSHTGHRAAADSLSFDRSDTDCWFLKKLL